MTTRPKAHEHRRQRHQREEHGIHGDAAHHGAQLEEDVHRAGQQEAGGADGRQGGTDDGAADALQGVLGALEALGTSKRATNKGILSL